MKYFFVFGNFPRLARAELASVLNVEVEQSDERVFVLESEKLEEDVFDKLGGTVKVGEVIDADINIADYIKQLGLTSVDFGVSVYSGDVNVIDISKEIKRDLVDAGVKARFVLPKDGDELSSVVVKKQKLVEFLVFNDVVARTIWVQDFESWGNRDFGRPSSETKIGMLPPKVARQMINIAMSGERIAESGISILDPFCGVGTVLAEALTLGLNVIGNDINASQVSRTKKNLEWLGQGKFKLFVGDARKIIDKVGTKKIDAIVTEPDLGPNSRLYELYSQCLVAWRDVLKDDGCIVMVLPSVGDNDELMKKVIDKAALIGYSLVQGPFSYFRPQAKVKRNIVKFVKI